MNDSKKIKTKEYAGETPAVQLKKYKRGRRIDMKHEPIHFEIVDQFGDERRVRIACDNRIVAAHILTTSVPGNESCLKCQDWVNKNHKDKVNEKFKF